MTFCLGIKVKDGLIGIADTRVTSGSECITARKLTFYEHKQKNSLFLMTSGLRSLRDKTLTYFDEVLCNDNPSFDRLYKAVNALAEQIRKVAAEDRAALAASGLPFDIYCLVGGQMRGDKEHKLYLLYPEGNWVEIQEGTPYHIIGASTYGKPVLDRTLNYEDSLFLALKVGCLAFDSTRISAADVDFPIDVVLYEKDSFRLGKHRFEGKELEEFTRGWQERLRQSMETVPADVIEEAFARLAADAAAKRPTAERKNHKTPT